MGFGIAKSIKEEFPEAFMQDQQTKRGDRSKLGGFSWVNVTRNENSFIVVNAYTQYDFWNKNVRVDYDAIRSVFRMIKSQYGHLRIGYPTIGAGLARGNWVRINAIIDEELNGSDHTLVRFVP